MCGIAGYVNHTATLPENIIGTMAAALQRRGPDDSGTEHWQITGAQVAFGFRRLSIIDLSANGHQPMFTDDRECCIVFNGEVYNFREIRKELEQKGYRFRSGTDTEVVLYAYREWGEACVHRFNGMFAFALYDARRALLLIYRDRLGVKPLYYYHTPGHLVFASELKAIYAYPHFKKNINISALGLYLAHGYIDAPHAVFHDTYKLPPGHYMRYDLAARKMTIHRYWSVDEAYAAPKSKLSFDEAAEQLEALMIKAFRYRTIADVPVGVFLSGGYDSTAVAALLQRHVDTPVLTFTIGFQETDFDESQYAAKVAAHLGCTHHERRCAPADALDLLQLYTEVYDEPFGDSSALPTMLVSKLARDHGVKVALSADGGDELFGGYRRYRNALQKISRWKIKNRQAGKLLEKIPAALTVSRDDKAGKLAEFLSASSVAERYQIIIKSFTQRELKRLLPGYSPLAPHSNFYDVEGLCATEQMMRYDTLTYLPDDILHKVDRATMGMSIEGREPFLDYTLVSYVAGLPAQYKFTDTTTKKILRHIVHRYVPPHLMERPKMGFGIPIEKWLQKELITQAELYFSADFIRRQNIFDAKMMGALLRDIKRGVPIPGERLARLYLFQRWWERWCSS
ncbi:MAG: asparagine synthase (glutamine-hydrolyzing) [Chitinophagales bacterium]|nr:asparagine synthase (glutamine-hydrolyzing) [Chitinophagales bacterium]MDW8419156.1 asparagine synthase (glutamine-hydrolyzing) [Chitinophagales bacterium]